MLILIIVIVVVLVVLASVPILAFNKLRKADIGAQEALGGIDVQLTRRSELIPNLVATVTGYADHEAGVLEAVTGARTRVADAAAGADVTEKAAADAALSTSLVDVLAVAEAYPDLKASANFQDLQKQLADTENQISFARQYYNDSVTRLNSLVATIPYVLFSAMAGVERREFYRAPEGAGAVPQVDFGNHRTTPAVPPAVPPAAAPPAVGPPTSPPAEQPGSGEPPRV